MSPYRDLPESFDDAIWTDTVVVLGLWDQLRALVGRRIRVRNRICCERAPGRTRCDVSIATVDRSQWWPPWRRRARGFEQIETGGKS